MMLNCWLEHLLMTVGVSNFRWINQRRTRQNFSISPCKALELASCLICRNFAVANSFKFPFLRSLSRGLDARQFVMLGHIHFHLFYSSCFLYCLVSGELIHIIIRISEMINIIKDCQMGGPNKITLFFRFHANVSE